MRFKKYLTEKYIKSFTAYKSEGRKYNRYTEIYENPTKSDYAAVLKAMKEDPVSMRYVRLAFDGKKLFMWRGDVLHDVVMKEIHLPKILPIVPRGTFLEIYSYKGWQPSPDDIKSIKRLVSKFFTFTTVTIDYIDEKEYLEKGASLDAVLKKKGFRK